jgi:hypothetical protein
METEHTKLKPDLYIAVVVYESSADAQDYDPLYEESFMIIEADSEEEAREKALSRVNEPHSYKNQYGATITWSFKQLVQLLNVWDAGLKDGAELCSRFFQNYEAYGLTFLSHQR